ncbi:lysylphosphatidylglycerol synthase transmembrane domain-containing protein [Phycisphaerales bacterium AB-hyl4]|uniref:Lysylphosphatidylglycerol synthase transmembrane domain-containing protein n=1 Tax=Natronomicrosphaera hydrolytica TaxID=3242702 RepID=A0ABV4U3N2_9BACT
MTDSLTNSPPSHVDAAVGGRRSVKAWLGTFIQVGLTVALLTWLFSDPAVREGITRTLTQANLGWLLVGVGLGAVWISAAACRWQIFLRIQGIRISFRRSTGIYLIGMFFTLFLPGLIGGEAVRMVYICRERPKQKTAAALSVMMDHMAGMVAMLATTAAIVAFRYEWLAQSPVGIGGTASVLVGLSFAVLGLFAMLIVSKRRLDRGLPEFVPARDKLNALLAAFTLFLTQWRWSLAGIALSFVTLHGYFAVFYAAGRAFNAPASFIDVFSVMPLIDVASALPISISGLGVREALLENMLHAMADVPAEAAVLIGLGGFGCWAAWCIVGGLIFACYRPSREADTLSLRELLRSSRNVQSNVETIASSPHHEV